MGDADKVRRSIPLRHNLHGIRLILLPVSQRHVLRVHVDYFRRVIRHFVTPVEPLTGMEARRVRIGGEDLFVDRLRYRGVKLVLVAIDVDLRFPLH